MSANAATGAVEAAARAIDSISNIAAFAIGDEAALALSGALLQDLKAARKTVESSRDSVIKPLKAEIDAHKTTFDGFLATIKRIDDYLRGQVLAWREQQRAATASRCVAF